MNRTSHAGAGGGCGRFCDKPQNLLENLPWDGERPWLTTFVPILISFSFKLVSGPVLDRLQRRQRAEVAEVVAECVKLELHGVGSERAACQPRLLDRAFAEKSGRSFRSPLSMEGVDCCGFLPACLDPYAIEHGDEGELGFGYRGFGLSSALDENADENYELLLNTIATSLDRIAAKPVA
jgi:hypothetical protein